MRGIKNREKLAREDLVISLLKSESSALENNFRNNNDNNDTDDDDDDDNTYDGKIRGEICDIKILFNQLANIVTNKDGKKIIKDLYEIEKKAKLFR